MYCLGTIDYPDEPLYVGKYLGPTIEVGPAMTTKIIQNNSKVVYRSTYQPLTVEEQIDMTVQQDMLTVRESTKEHQGERLTCAELDEVSLPNTPEYIL